MALDPLIAALTQMGVMAQDVQKKNPKAVKRMGDLLAVDYRGVR